VVWIIVAVVGGTLFLGLAGAAAWVLMRQRSSEPAQVAANAEAAPKAEIAQVDLAEQNNDHAAQLAPEQDNGQQPQEDVGLDPPDRPGLPDDPKATRRPQDPPFAGDEKLSAATLNLSSLPPFSSR
jgi:hypothetical protein